MSVMYTELKIVRKGGPKVNLLYALKQPMLKTAKRLSAIGLEAARANYMSKRKTKKMPSFVFGSFDYGGTISVGVGNVTSVVFAGGTKASWAPYVDIGHRLRNNAWWEGYHFMKAGGRRSLKEFPIIAKEEIRKKFRNISII